MEGWTGGRVFHGRRNGNGGFTERKWRIASPLGCWKVSTDGIQLRVLLRCGQGSPGSRAEEVSYWGEWGPTLPGSGLEPKTHHGFTRHVERSWDRRHTPKTSRCYQCTLEGQHKVGEDPISQHEDVPVILHPSRLGTMLTGCARGSSWLEWGHFSLRESGYYLKKVSVIWFTGLADNSALCFQAHLSLNAQQMKLCNFITPVGPR